MDEDVVIMIASAVTVLGGMSILLTGWVVWLKHRAKRLTSPDDIARLQRAVDDLRLEVGALGDGQSELHERLDFAERLLSQDRPERLPDKH